MTISPSGLHRDGKPCTDWPNIRAFILRRDERQCQKCGASDANEVDHIWPRRLGGADHIDNLRAICGPCNKAKGARADYLSATNRQLTLALGALGGRVSDADNELNEVIGELLKRQVAGDDRLYLGQAERLIADRTRKTLAHLKVMESAFVMAVPPITLRECVLRIKSAAGHLPTRTDAWEMSADTLVSLLSVHHRIQQLIDAAAPRFRQLVQGEPTP